MMQQHCWLSGRDTHTHTPIPAGAVLRASLLLSHTQGSSKAPENCPMYVGVGVGRQDWKSKLAGDTAGGAYSSGVHEVIY